MPHFTDTNIVVYAYSDTGPKSQRAGELVFGAVISVQVLNEFANVAIRKLGYDETELDHRISSIRRKVSAIFELDQHTHDLARRLAFRYRLSFYDSALLASALLADCDIFYSEDLQDGLVIEEYLTIRNPFA